MILVFGVEMGIAVALATMVALLATVVGGAALHLAMPDVYLVLAIKATVSAGLLGFVGSTLAPSLHSRRGIASALKGE